MPYRPKTYRKKKPYQKRKPYRKRYNKKYARKGGIPFPLTKNCTFLYKNTSATLTPGAVYGAQRFRLNCMYDFDFDNNFGNKQPLYYDNLLDGTGPYRSFRVNAWKVTFKVVNISDIPVTIYWHNGSLNSVNDADIQGEMQNMPRVKSLQLTGKTGSKSIGTISAYGTVKGVLGKKPDDVFEGKWDASPNQMIHGTLGYLATDGVSTSLQIVCEMQCIQYVTLFNRDAIVS